MDIYSFGMIGYEILTRNAVYSGASVSHEVVLNKIMFRGQKPDVTLMNEVENSLRVKTINDFEIFRELDEIVKQSWETEPEDRPKIRDVKKRLEDLAQSKKIFEKATDKAAKEVIKRKKLLPALTHVKERPSKTTALKLWITLSTTSTLVFVTAFVMIYHLSTNLEVSHNGSFLGTVNHELVRYNVFSKNFSVASKGTRTYTPSSELTTQIIFVTDMVYVFSYASPWDKSRFTRYVDYVWKSNSSAPTLGCSSWEKVHWKERYHNRNYLAFNNNILAIGDLTEYYPRGNDAVDLYNTTTGEWTSLQRMNEPRTLHSLALFQGLICSIGGYESKTSECYDLNTNKWAYLPKMNVVRRRAAAVELNGELYVTGGDMFYDMGGELRSVEKYNPDLEAWFFLAPMIERRSRHAAGMFNGKIYVIGGGSDLVEAYDPSNNVWETVDSITLSKNVAFTVA